VGRVAVVTGANQGLGFALVEGLAQRLTADDVVYLTGRDGERVRSAMARVRRARARLAGAVVDVRSDAMVAEFAAGLARAHGGVDLFFSNAAARLWPDRSSSEMIGTLVDTNNLGTTRMLRLFAPLLRQRGRLLVVASDSGSLRQLPAHLHSRFDTEAIGLDKLDETILAWRDAVLRGDAERQGWPSSINIPSKVGQVAAMRIVARELAGARRDLFFAAVCPGRMDTAASRAWFGDKLSDAQAPAQAARVILDLALRADVPLLYYGELVQFGQVIPWQ
jgi:carbonyl reductase 1